MPHPLSTFFFRCALVGAAPVAWAQSSADDTAPVAPPATTTLAPVLVRGKSDHESATSPVDGYRAKNAASATKTDTPLRETPQSVTVVTRDQFVDQGATNLQDALNYAAGVRSNAYGLDSRSDGFRVRGAYPDEYLDGLRKNFEYYTSNARTEPFSLERIEVLRGPAAMLYGQGSTGGVVNMVSKRPQATTQGEFGLQLGSWGRKQAQVDLTGPLSGPSTGDSQWLYRLIAVQRKADTQVDFVRDDRSLFAPSLTWQPSASTSLTLQALYQKDKTGSTSQFFPWSGTLTANPNGRLPTSRFIGDKGDRYDTERSSLGWLFEHRIDDRWTVRQNVRYTATDNDYRSLYGDSFTAPGDWAGDPTGKRLFGRFASEDVTKTKLFTADQHVQGRIDTGSVGHTVLLGLDVATYRKTGQSAFALPVYYPGGTVPLIDAYAPTYVPFTMAPLADITPFRQRQTGLYLQDQIRIDERWLATLGLRHDRARNETDGEPVETSSATTKRFGLLYATEAGWSPYVSYSESFNPVANIGNQTFKPLRGKQWEAGVKFEPTGTDLSFNAAAYDLREQNQLQQDPTTNLYAQLGETHAKGIELELKATFARSVDVIANYTYTHVDDLLENLPAHQASVWVKWRLASAGLGGISVGAGVRYTNAFADGNAPTVPATTLLDLLAEWDTGPWRVALNVNNATDRAYVSTCLRRGDCWWGARRNIVASLSYRY